MSEIRYGIKSLSPKYFNINSEWIIYISYPKITTEMIPILKGHQKKNRFKKKLDSIKGQ